MVLVEVCLLLEACAVEQEGVDEPPELEVALLDMFLYGVIMVFFNLASAVNRRSQ